MTTDTQQLTSAQRALKNYYETIISLEEQGVIGDHAGDTLSAQMMEWVGDWPTYNGTTYEG